MIITEIEIMVQVIQGIIIEDKHKEDLEIIVILEIKVDSLKETTILIIIISIGITTTTGVVIIEQRPQVGRMTKSDNERDRD